MASLNKVILIGNLGRDPDTRYLPNGDAVANISVATTDTWKDKNGEKQEKTEWHRVTLYRRLGEIAGEYLKKGSQVYIEGRIEYREYEKDGVKRYSTDIIASEMKMLGSRQGGGDPGDRDVGSTSERPPRASAGGGGGGGGSSGGSGSGAAPAKKKVDDFDDDIPF
ncbi:MAG: single-stranded DNA-binding protein [Betaproteobacteria bacterium]|nr:single-stranded DNA-binding protein [Betaproteobacteria bacterium]